MNLKSVKKVAASSSIAYVADMDTNWKQLGLAQNEIDYISSQLKKDVLQIVLNDLGKVRLICVFKQDKEAYKTLENCRMAGAEATKTLNKLKIDAVTVINESRDADAAILFAEGMALSNYQFLKYKKDAAKEQNSLQAIAVLADSASPEEVAALQALVEGVCASRDLVNEPLSYLTAEQLSAEIKKLGRKAKFKVSVFNKKKITSLGMGGLLAVNLGSMDPPTFNILAWKPKKPVNDKPIILVGKGVVYDTGGLSLKPTANSMDYMKCDMGGAAAVIGAIYAIAKNQLPVHVIGLIPATDNRPGLNAYVPGDVITMHNKLTVEVLNTDAEGRMILADALSYAQKYKPEMVVDAATLTGSAVMAVGNHGLVMMSNTDDNNSNKALLKKGSYKVHERVVEMPLWEEYQEQLKSEIADLKNIGGRLAGAITAGKFLENFTDYPWMHVDIAPMAWSFTENGYRPKNGTGVGVRLFYEFIKQRAENK